MQNMVSFCAQQPTAAKLTKGRETRPLRERFEGIRWGGISPPAGEYNSPLQWIVGTPVLGCPGNSVSPHTDKKGCKSGRFMNRPYESHTAARGFQRGKRRIALFSHIFIRSPFGRLGVRDHTAGPGGSLHTFSPERKYDILPAGASPRPTNACVFDTFNCAGDHNRETGNPSLTKAFQENVGAAFRRPHSSSVKNQRFLPPSPRGKALQTTDGRLYMVIRKATILNFQLSILNEKGVPCGTPFCYYTIAQVIIAIL